MVGDKLVYQLLQNATVPSPIQQSILYARGKQLLIRVSWIPLIPLNSHGTTNVQSPHTEMGMRGNGNVTVSKNFLCNSFRPRQLACLLCFASLLTDHICPVMRISRCCNVLEVTLLIYAIPKSETQQLRCVRQLYWD